MNRDHVWATPGINKRDVDRFCKLCGCCCIPKNIGVICVICINKIPKHIPDAQLEKYIKISMRNAKMGVVDE